MRRGTLSAEGRKRVSAAPERRWAAYYAAKAAGRQVTMAFRSARSRGKPATSRLLGKTGFDLNNGFLGAPTHDLIRLRRQIDQELADRLVRQRA